MKQIFTVADMKCAMCAETIRKAVEQVPAVEGVAVAVEAKQVTVTGQASADAVAAAIRTAGFTPTAA